MQGYLLLALSLFLETAKNTVNNDFSKNKLKQNVDIYKFGFSMYVCSFLLLAFVKTESPSLSTVIMAVLFAACLGANQYFFLKALQTGPLAFSNFIQGTSLLIPTVLGVLLWKEAVSVIQVISLVVLIVSLFCVLNVQLKKSNLLWWLHSLLAMVSMGAIGVIQSVHQMGPHKAEILAFLKLSFLFTALIYLAFWLVSRKTEAPSFPFKSAAMLQAVLSGAFMGGVHVINLFLAGTLPKIVFFPAANGGVILLTLLLSVLIFREKITKLQWIGLLSGVLALCLIGVG